MLQFNTRVSGEMSADRLYNLAKVAVREARADRLPISGTAAIERMLAAHGFRPGDLDTARAIAGQAHLIVNCIDA